MHKILMPSFYSFLGFTIPFFLYCLMLVKWNTPSLVSIIIFSSFSLLNGISYYFYNRKMNQRIKSISRLKKKKSLVDIFSLYFCATIGMAGYIFYYKDLIATFQIKWLIIFITHGARQIRLYEPEGVSTQLTYFGWIACCLISFYLSSKKISRYWIYYIVASVIMSLGYVDRVKPISILFFSTFGYLSGLLLNNYKKIKLYRVAKIVIIVLSIGLLIYIGIALSLDKISGNRYGETILPATIANIYIYLTGGFAYFDNIIGSNFIGTGFYMFFYPLFKFFSMFHIFGYDSFFKENLPFLSLPMIKINVATGLEPIYSSFGLIGLVFFCIMYPFGADKLAIYLVTLQSDFKIVVMATIAWTSLFLFFTLRITSTPFYFIMIFSILTMILNFLSQRKRRKNIFLK